MRAFNDFVKVLENFEAFGENTAILDDSGASLSYAQLAQETQALAEAAEGRCLVFVLCGDTIGSVLGYAAFMNAHIVPLMLNKHTDPALLAASGGPDRPYFRLGSLQLKGLFSGED